MAVLLPHGAFLTEDRLTFTLGTAEPLGVSPPEAVDSLLIELNFSRATRLASVLSDTIPSGKTLLRHNHGNIEIPTEILRSLHDVGHGSKAKPSVFVAMPFASEYDDH